MKIKEKTAELTTETLKKVLKITNDKFSYLTKRDKRKKFNDPVQYLFEIFGSFFFIFIMTLPSAMAKSDRYDFWWFVYNIYVIHSLWLTSWLIFSIIIFSKFGIQVTPFGTTFAIKRKEIKPAKGILIFFWQVIGAFFALWVMYYLTNFANTWIEYGTVINGVVQEGSTFGAPLPMLNGFGTRTNKSINFEGEEWFYVLQFVLSICFTFLFFFINWIIVKKMKTPLSIILTRFLITWILIIFGMKFNVHITSPIRAITPAIFTLIWGGNQFYISALMVGFGTLTALILIIIIGKSKVVNRKTLQTT